MYLRLAVCAAIVSVLGCKPAGRHWTAADARVYSEPGSGEMRGKIRITNEAWLYRSAPRGNVFTEPGDCKLAAGQEYALVLVERGQNAHHVRFAPDVRLVTVDGSPCSLTEGYVGRFFSLVSVEPPPSAPASDSPAAPTAEASSTPQTFTAMDVFTDYLYDSSPEGAWDFTLLLNGGKNGQYPANMPPIPSPCAGVVTSTRSMGGYGNTIEIRCGDGYTWFMAHLAGHFVREGASVAKGTPIARQGSTGHSTGAHVHLEIGDRQSNTITNRSVTEPLVRSYFAFVRAGGGK